MKTKILTGSIIATYALLNTPAFAEETTLDPIVVTADFREAKLSETANSVSVIGEEKIYDKSSAAFEEVVGRTPNVNFAGGASRAHYIQIRGIGERSQFTTPVNPSVGINIDGIEFSQSALGVTLFDVNQIEVLRGPQGTTFGATGMAGVINVQSNEPTKETEGRIEATIGDYNTKAFGAAVGGTLVEDTLIGRFSVYKNTSDGYMKNSHIDSEGNQINRDDNNNIDELTAKAQLRWFASDNHTVDLNYIHLDVDNGYDAFSLDNTRTTNSDEQGKDTQETDAFSLKSTYQVNPKMHLVSKISHSNSDLEYSYDEDWSYVGQFDEELAIINADRDPDVPDDYYIWPYSYFDQYLRDREQTDMDVRLISDEEGRIFNGSTDWTMGVYLKNYTEDLTRNRRKEDTYVLFTNEYKTKNRAIYGQLDSVLTPKLTLTTGFRAEKWEVSYSDSDAVNINTDENLYGGKIGLQYQQDSSHLYYVNLSRGYKPGGVNADNRLEPQDKEYETETLWNLDVGLNSSYLDNTLISRLNLFYGERKDQQVKIYIPLQQDWIDYLSNAAEGHYYGLEASLDYYPNDNIHLYTSLGLLKSEFDDYDAYDEDGNPIDSFLEGRAPAHAPEYQYNIGLDYRFVENWMFKANAEGKGSYYFSNTHNEKSDSYTLFNSSLEYTYDNWTATVWVKNITDEDYYVRGFYWYQDPSIEYAETRYTQLGAPRTVGFTVAYDF